MTEHSLTRSIKRATTWGTWLVASALGGVVSTFTVRFFAVCMFSWLAGPPRGGLDISRFLVGSALLVTGGFLGGALGAYVHWLIVHHSGLGATWWILKVGRVGALLSFGWLWLAIGTDPYLNSLQIMLGTPILLIISGIVLGISTCLLLRETLPHQGLIE